MTFSYENPQDGQFRDPVHNVRFLLRDIRQGTASLSDEEIQYLIATTKEHDPNADLYAVAAQAAEYMADAYDGLIMVQKTVGNTRLNKTFSSEKDRYQVIASRLWARSNTAKWYGILGGFGLAAASQPIAQFRSRMMDPLGSTGGASYPPPLSYAEGVYATPEDQILER